MKTVAIIQARMGSSRLPGKVMMDLCGKPMLVRQLERLARCTRVDEVCIATTELATDDVIATTAATAGVRYFRGSQEDVLSRYVGAAALTQATLVVRITGDCPLIAPDIVDAVVAKTIGTPPCDYCSNTETRRYPRGLDCEALTRDALVRADQLATSRASREHVTWFVHTERRDLFKRREVIGPRDDSDLRWTVDLPEDLEMVRALFAIARLGERDVPYDELVAIARANPQIAALNAGIAQKSS